MRIGLVSDTHNLVRPEVLAWLASVDHILHAGDICEAAVLEALRAIAPVTAVRGNNDQGAWADAIPGEREVVLGGVRIWMIHDLHELERDPRAHAVRVVLSGHSHQPRVEERDGVLFVNPGSAGPRRFTLPISLGELRIDGAKVTARTAHLDDGRWHLQQP